MGLAARRQRIEQLRAQIAGRFRGALVLGAEARSARARGPALPSGWRAVDRALPEGGLAPGETALLQAPPGGGGLALASSWARVASCRGEPVIVLDAHVTTAPHAWVEPPDARAPIWVVRPPTPPDVWPAIDIALRSGAFGLVLLLDPGAAPPGAGARLCRLTREREARLVVTGTASFPAQARIALRLTSISWEEAPAGLAPADRALEVRATSGHRTGAPDARAVVHRDDTLTDRLRPAPRAADRRPSSGRSGRAARDAGRGGRG